MGGERIYQHKFFVPSLVLATGCYDFFFSFGLVELKMNEEGFVEPVIMALSENCSR